MMMQICNFLTESVYIIHIQSIPRSNQTIWVKTNNNKNYLLNSINKMIKRM